MDPIYEIDLDVCPHCGGVGAIQDEQGWCVYAGNFIVFIKIILSNTSFFHCDPKSVILYHMFILSDSSLN